MGWTDAESSAFPGDESNRKGNTSYYRVAVAAGKSIPFPQPAWGGQDFGTDGGMHNFLRYLEDRGRGWRDRELCWFADQHVLFAVRYGQFQVLQRGVRTRRTRNYFFDTQFLNPNNLPPGTPMFQDIVSLSYHQDFMPQ